MNEHCAVHPRLQLSDHSSQGTVHNAAPSPVDTPLPLQPRVVEGNADRPSTLFRPESIDARFGDQNAASAIIVPPAFKAFAIAISLVITAGFVAAASLSYTRTERVTGYLAPDRGLVRVHPIQPGVVQQRKVEVGDVVVPGQTLFVLGSDRSGLSGTPMAATAAQLTRNAIDELKQQIVRVQKQHELEATRAIAERQQGEAELGSMADLLTIQQQRQRLLQDQLDGLERLQRAGHISQYEYASRRLALLSEAEAIRLTRAKRESLKRTIAIAELRTQTEHLDTQNRISQLRSQLATLHKLLVSEAVEQHSTITASVGGRVASIQADVGHYVSPGASMMTIVPDDAILCAELLVPSSSIARIVVGQTAYISYHGLSDRDSDRQQATVVQISQVPMIGTDIPAPFQLGQPIYRVVATLPSNRYRFENHDVPLIPGMRLDAEIAVDRQPMLAQLLGIDS